MRGGDLLLFLLLYGHRVVGELSISLCIRRRKNLELKLMLKNEKWFVLFAVADM
jgi:hypothetical protein